MISLRPYQEDAIEAILNYWAGGGGCPLADLATGLGKSVVIGEMVRRLLDDYPDMRILMLVHVRELVAQNYQALIRVWPGAPAGIYSAGLRKRDARSRIVFGSIQSVYKKARELGPRDVVIIDECHLVPATGDGMYRRLLSDLRRETPDMRVVGFTATPYRMDSGRLDIGGLFDETVFSYGVGAGIRDGWLAPLRSKASATQIDVSSVAKRGGEFIPGALEEASDKDEITRAAVAEMIAYGADRRSWLVFCTGVHHAAHVADALREAGIPAAHITGDTPSDKRDSLIQAFRRGELRALTNANVLTTGFDAPSVDLIAFLRPTLSTGLYVQMVGRGTRKAEGKTDCLVLDFSGNVRRHGPVDIATIDTKRGKNPADDADGADDEKVAESDVRAKACPECETLIHKREFECWHCGFKFPLPVEKIRHQAVADDTPILSSEIPKRVNFERLSGWTCAPHFKLGAPTSLRVTYLSGLIAVNEWVCFEHVGYARTKAEMWWAKHGGSAPAPKTVDEAIERWEELSRPWGLHVDRNGRWPEIKGRVMSTPAEEVA